MNQYHVLVESKFFTWHLVYAESEADALEAGIEAQEHPDQPDSVDATLALLVA